MDHPAGPEPLESSELREAPVPRWHVQPWRGSRHVSGAQSRRWTASRRTVEPCTVRTSATAGNREVHHGHQASDRAGRSGMVQLEVPALRFVPEPLWQAVRECFPLSIRGSLRSAGKPGVTPKARGRGAECPPPGLSDKRRSPTSGVARPPVGPLDRRAAHGKGCGSP